jgi:hypothetical protein
MLHCCLMVLLSIRILPLFHDSSFFSAHSHSTDATLKRLIGDGEFIAWRQVAQGLANRSTKQCRDRWFNVLNPQMKRGRWTAEEDSGNSNSNSNSNSTCAIIMYMQYVHVFHESALRFWSLPQCMCCSLTTPTPTH